MKYLVYLSVVLVLFGGSQLEINPDYLEHGLKGTAGLVVAVAAVLWTLRRVQQVQRQAFMTGMSGKLTNSKYLLLLVFLFALPVDAQNVRCSEARGGRECAAAATVKQELSSLNLTDSGWVIVILDEMGWETICKQWRCPSDSAFTLLSMKRTYLRELSFNRPRDSQSRRTDRLRTSLMHEWVHILLDSTDEELVRRETSKRLSSL